MSVTTRKKKKRERERAAKEWPCVRCRISAFCFSFAYTAIPGRHCSLCDTWFIQLPILHYLNEYRIMPECPAARRGVQRVYEEVEERARDGYSVGGEDEEERKEKVVMDMQCGECKDKHKQVEHAKNTPQIDYWRKTTRKLPRERQPESYPEEDPNEY